MNIKDLTIVKTVTMPGKVLDGLIADHGKGGIFRGPLKEWFAARGIDYQSEHLGVRSGWCKDGSYQQIQFRLEGPMVMAGGMGSEIGSLTN